ncbi:hypothetical protein D3C87_1180020 [compost metagenome]
MSVKFAALNVASVKISLARVKLTVAPFRVASFSVPEAVKLGGDAVVKFPVSFVKL